MTAIAADHAGWVLLVVAFLSCLVLPVPTSALMVAAGGLVALGDLGWGAALGAPLLGAVLGDQAGYALGRRGGPGLRDWLARRPARAAAGERARGLILAQGIWAVFVTRWLLAPLGPYVNVACGVAGMGWARFSAAAVAGKVVWVGLYVGAGFAVAGNLVAAGRAVGPVLAAGIAMLVMIALASWLKLRRARKDRSPGALRMP